MPSALTRSDLAELSRRAWGTAIRCARWAAPHLRTAARGVWAASVALAGHALRRRALIARVLTRVAWWSALWLWLVAGSAFFDLGQPLDGPWLAARFVGGFVLCLLVLALATERRMRWAGWLLGLGHGALGLLALTLFGA